jgi:hypothetical protein
MIRRATRKDLQKLKSILEAGAARGPVPPSQRVTGRAPHDRPRPGPVVWRRAGPAEKQGPGPENLRIGALLSKSDQML